MAMLFQDGLAGLDPLRVLQLCVVHDLGEALGGDVPAIVRDAHPDKSARERDLLQLARSLDPAARERLLALWDEYEAAATPEARAVKALDKMETILQHSQGDNPPDFDYGFNLTYGRDYAQHDEVLRAADPGRRGHGAQDGDPARRFIIRLNRSGFDPVQRTCAAHRKPARSGRTY